MKQITDFNAQKLMTKIMKWGTQLVFLAALLVMTYLSFVDDFEIKPSIQNITTVALVALVLNWIVWDSRYKSEFDKAMTADIMAKDYSIHRRYYFARKNLKQNEVQQYIRQYNQDFVQAWFDDIEDITGRTIKDIEEHGYKGYDHKYLIWRVKHHKYPESGLKRSRDVLSVLNISGSEGMKIQLRKAEHQHTSGRIQKLITSMMSVSLAASVTINFITDNWESACLTLLLNIVILLTSLFFGAAAGVKGAKIKLATAEQISELLEEWRKYPPKEEPYKDITDTNETKKVQEKSDKPIMSRPEGVIEIT